ncbi:YcnI family protein [Nocardioides humi]|uniref:YncI copper-binding domain-containing protein n=1 Tax=Nocardioides humi TaxID=449461 RepID=A0ABN2C1A5_9ACTN|nr:YcnI family protein [Nocardioides humi]
MSVRTSARPAARPAARLAAVALGAVAVLATAAPPAGAHVTVTPSTTAAGAYAVLTFSVGHGCDGSPTTAVTVQLPPEIVTVTPTVNPGWQVEKRMEELAEPVADGHGGEYTERVAQVVYTARSPLPDGLRDTFELSLKLTADEGATLVFPVVQSCEEGESAWVQTAAEGEEEPEHPAPYVTVGAAASDAHGHRTAEAEIEGEGDGGTGVVAWLGLVLGALGLAAGGTALARSRR